MSALKLLCSNFCTCFFPRFELKFAFVPSTFRPQAEGDGSGAKEQPSNDDNGGGSSSGSAAAAAATGASNSNGSGRYALRITAHARLAPLVIGTELRG